MIRIKLYYSLLLLSTKLIIFTKKYLCLIF